MLELPPPSNPTETNEQGDKTALSGIGPVVVNTDGTISRIKNWDQLSPAEQKTTFNLLNKRNPQRLKAIREEKCVDMIGKKPDTADLGRCRIVRKGDMMTRDMDEERINLFVDEKGLCTHFTCG